VCPGCVGGEFYAEKLMVEILFKDLGSKRKLTSCGDSIGRLDDALRIGGEGLQVSMAGI
jgi:hypothetical protein